jgi:hypothetical protein
MSVHSQCLCKNHIDAVEGLGVAALSNDYPEGQINRIDVKVYNEVVRKV